MISEVETDLEHDERDLSDGCRVFNQRCTVTPAADQIASY